MPSRSSIFSSRILGSALIWTVLSIILIEWLAQRALPAQHPSHEVDRLLFDLDHGRVPDGDTIFLGDSVGRQIAHALLRQSKGSFVPLASNAAIETPGQYYVLQRYLEHHPAPRRVILMMGNPVEGQLHGNYTENYVQRGFLRWREMAELAWARKSLPFGLVMAGYRISPVFRYRLSLQKKIPLLETPNPYFGQFDMSTPSAAPPASTKHGILAVIDAAWNHLRPGPTIAEIYFLRLAAFLEKRNIEWLYLPLPIPESAARMLRPDEFYGRQIARVAGWSGQFPSMRAGAPPAMYPDDWFRDGSHFHDEPLATVARDYARLLDSMGFGPNQ